MVRGIPPEPTPEPGSEALISIVGETPGARIGRMRQLQKRGILAISGTKFLKVKIEDNLHI